MVAVVARKLAAGARQLVVRGQHVACHLCGDGYLRVAHLWARFFHNRALDFASPREDLSGASDLVGLI